MQKVRLEKKIIGNKRLIPEKIITNLWQIEVLMRQGISRVDVIRQIGEIEQTDHHWCRQYGGIGVDQLKELKRLLRENEELRRAVFDLKLNKLILNEVARGTSEPRSLSIYDKQKKGQTFP